MYVRYYHPREKRFLRWNSADRMTPGKPGKPLSGRHLPDRACIDSPWIRELSGRGVAVAVIDSGVNPEHPHVSRAAGGVGIKLSGDVSEDFVDRLGHGTAVFAAIQEKAPEADLFAVRVFEDRLRTSVRALVAAIDWAAERGVRIVNLSLGTLREDHAGVLEGAVGRLAAAGGVVVAAAEAEGRTWWPGSLPLTVGVVMDKDCPRGCGVGWWWRRRIRDRSRGCPWSAISTGSASRWRM